ncbi:MAG: P1 family peptidase [Desulfobacterales bacterium]|nr:P1 family peptidase [Desulfobacterales bacterium]
MTPVDFMEIPGIKVGHAQDEVACTGCTVILSEQGATMGVDVRGGAPGTRETDLLDPVNLVEKGHGVLLAGGSAFGLDAAAGVMSWLEGRGVGFDVQVTRVPIVCGAALFDLTIGDHRVRPDRAMGILACDNASGETCPQGSVGAGTGATVGKILGMDTAMKGGIGHGAFRAGELMVGALVVVNCLGDVVDPDTGEQLAGPLDADKKRLFSTEEIMVRAYAEKKNLFSGNTTLGLVATNASLTKAQATKVSAMAQNGYARTMRPAHTMFDGDTIFTMATGGVGADLSVVGLMAAHAVERAVISAVKHANSLAGVKSRNEVFGI